MDDKFYAKSIDETLEILNSSVDGLSLAEVNQRQDKYGYNELEEGEKTTLLDIFIDQFRDIIIWILIFAAIISGITGDHKEAILILIILVLNAGFGVYQEWKADKAIEALKDMTTFSCRVIRDGETKQVESRDLVPGDVILIEQGDRIPADARLISNKDLKIQESALTGESTDIAKTEELVLEEDTSIADRKNMIYMGSFATFGQGKAVVTTTGMQTEMGQIAETVQSLEEGKTPFQIKIEEFGKNLGYGILVLSAVIIIVGSTIGGQDFLEMLKIGVSLAVAAIPEGLPIIITLVLALGVQTMARHNAIIKKLPVVESLGSTTVIATDKTGTLTRNQQTVVQTVYFNTTGAEVIPEEGKLQDPPQERVKRLYEAAVLCNNANVDDDNVYGDPTEQAMLNDARLKGFHPNTLRDQSERLNEIPFDSARKRMNTLVSYDGQIRAYMKGAPDIVLNLCKYIDLGKGKQELTDALRTVALNKMENMASEALRVLAFAYVDATDDTDLEEAESEMIFVGYMGMIDPAKDGVKEAIAHCYTAGIRVVMATGDHKVTAAAIGKDIGMNIPENGVMTGKEIDDLSDEDFKERVNSVNIFARISPSHKLRIMQALKDNDEVVAMTGDGVNDAPAIKGADIGISMGIQGTDVTKETADMILQDDNFATIVGAVEEGRAIYDNMARFIRYMMSSNLAEIMVVFLAIVFGWSIPLLAVQILFINLVTDGLPALAMAAEPHEDNIMERPPRDSNSSLLNEDNLFYIGRVAAYITFITLALFYWADFNANPIRASTIAFSTLVLCQLFNSFNLRHHFKSVLDGSILGNKPLFFTVVGSIILQILLVHGDQVVRLIDPSWGSAIGESFHVVPLELITWIIIFAASFGTILFEEVFKLIFRMTGYDKELSQRRAVSNN